MATRRSRRTQDALFEESLFNNMKDYTNFRDRLIDLAVARFKIKGLPKEIYEPFVVRSLVTNNEVLFFKDDILKEYICYPFVFESSQLDIYGRPKRRRVVCPNGYTNGDLDETNSVIIKSSMSGTPIINIINQYARKLYLISRTIDVNVNAQKTPVLILCDDNERLSFENLYRNYMGNEPVIKGSNELDVSKIKALRTDAPVVFNQLYELQSNLWNEYLTFLGISNITEKKERLVTDEVNRSLGGVIVARNNYINAIKRGLDEVNEMFGLNLELLFAEDESAAEAPTIEESEITTNE